LAANPDEAGTIALGVAKIAICLGKVDQTGGQAAIPAGTIDVATITVSAGCTATITADALRGGIVGDAVVAGTIIGGDIGLSVCLGDLCSSNTLGGPDGQVDTGDLQKLVAELMAAGAPYSIPSPSAVDVMDICSSNTLGAPDGKVDTGDLQKLVAELMAAGSPYVIPGCLSPVVAP
jgi:hypothetical protein